MALKGIIISCINNFIGADKMKKLLSILVVGLIGLMAVSAQSIPEGRELFPAVYDFATDFENAWTSAQIKNFDVQNDSYAVVGYAVQGKGITLHRDDYTVNIKKENGTFNVEITGYTTVACNKNGQPLPKATQMAKPKSSATKLAGFIVKDITDRLASWSDEEYSKKVDKVVTNPDFIATLAKKSSSLYVKKFIKKYNIEGKTVSFPLVLTSISENTLKNDQTFKYAMQVSGGDLPEKAKKEYLASGFMKENIFGYGNIVRETNVFFYSNNDDLIDKKEKDVMEISGTIQDITFNDITGKFSFYAVVESDK